MTSREDRGAADAEPTRIERTVGEAPDQQIAVVEDHSHATVGGAAVAGAVTGGVIGLAAGPAGAAAGAIGGAIVGAVAEQVLRVTEGPDPLDQGPEASSGVPHDFTHIPETGYGAAGETIAGDVPLSTQEYDQARGAADRPAERMP